MIPVYPFADSDLKEEADTASAVVDCRFNGRNPAAKLMTSELFKHFQMLDRVWDDVPHALIDAFGRAYARFEIVAVKNLRSFESREELALEVCAAAMAIMSFARVCALIRNDRERVAAVSKVTELPAIGAEAARESAKSQR